MERLEGGIWLQRGDADGFPTVSAVVLTARRALIIDTLTGPRDMEPVQTFLRENAGDRRLLVINTHHHWDHVDGNAAFAGEEIIAHVSCPRLIGARGEDDAPAPPREGLWLPSVTFDSRLVIADTDETVQLLHAPGHSEDSIVVYLERARVLFAGDALEAPMPSLGPESRARAWLATFARLRALEPRLIVPGHGPVAGHELIDANERYMVGVLEAVADARRSSVCVDSTHHPAERFLAAGATVPSSYRAVHAANLAHLRES